jgi:DNA-directed RNA polymerase specialized sigma24 family protein
MTPEGRAASMEELRADYKANGIGNLVWHELINLARVVGRKKPLSTDAGGDAGWDKSVHTSTNPLRDDEPLDSTHVLVNNFYLEFQSTLDQYKEMVERRGSVAQRPKYWFRDPERGRCTHWVLEIAHDMENLNEYRAFLYKYLDKTAVGVNYRTDPTVADALVARSKKILEESPYTSVVLGKKLGAKRYFHGSPKPGLQEPTLDDLDRAARRAHEVPRMKRQEGISKKTGEAKRASPVYTTEDLETLLRLVAEELPMGFTQRDLRKIFERLLPSWLPSSLEQPEEGYTEVDPAQETVLRSTVRQVMTSLTADEQVLLRGTFDDSISVQDVADILGVERQTVRNRVKALVANWVELLEDPTEDEVRMFLQLLKESVLNRTAGGHDDG